MTAALAGVSFRPDRIRLPPEIHATERAHRLVLEQGLPFRAAYRQVAEELRQGPEKPAGS